MEESAPEELAGSNLSSKEDLPMLIPKTLLFNYRIDLFSAKDDEMNMKEKILRANMKRTVQLFQNISGKAIKVEMWDDYKCLEKFEKLGMRALFFDFASEVKGMIRSDLCRLLMLHNIGGYYFDTDVAPIAGFEKVLAPGATFVTVRATKKSGGGGGFFQAFVAATPKHPIISRTLRKFKDWYDIYWSLDELNQSQLRNDTAKGNIGCALLAKSFQEWSARNSTDPVLVHQSGHVSQFFEEGQFVASRNDISPRPEQNWTKNLCDWAAIDNRTKKVVMLSRIYNGMFDIRCSRNLYFLDIHPV